MGSCQSTPNDGAVTPAPTTSSVGKKNHPKTSVPSGGGTQVSLKTTISTDNTTATSHDAMSSNSNNFHNEETDATASDGSDRENHRPVTTTKNNAAKPTTTHRVSRASKRLKPGYSSGGSSEYSDETETHKHLLDWKNELGADGDLCKGVVHIETDFGRPIEDFYDGVHDGPILGSGVAGVVRRVVHKKTGVNYAVKCLDLGLIQTEAGLLALREEIIIMCQLDHPNIVRLEEVYESESEIYLIQELCLGGDLFDRLDEQSDFHYTEAACAKLVKQILSSVRYLHSKNIIHRDLKLENFLFSSPDADSELRMIDFGLSKHFKYDGEIQHECVGTPYTVAPEVIRAKYDEKVDIWSIGVISFLLLCGETPFGGAEEGENMNYVRQNILRGEVKFEPEDLWEHVSDMGKAFVQRLLNPDPTQRPTAKEAQTDDWLLTYGKRDSSTGNKVLSPKLAQSLVEFKEYSDMRKVLCEVLSFTLLPEQIADLRKEFELVDTDGDGEISLCALRQVLMQNAEAGTLGALTEDEVSDVFNALRVRKSETKIRWHEFIAAGLSQCTFDERNLKLAFDRLDYDRKGYITFNDMKELLGTAQGDEDGHIEQMWQDGIAECSCPMGQFTYDDFRMFIKGQNKRDSKNEPVSPRGQRKSLRLSLDSPNSPLRRSLRLSLEGAPSSPSLDAVPEGSISPQPKHKVFPKFDQLAANIELPMLPALEQSGDENNKAQQPNNNEPTKKPPIDVDVAFPLDVVPHHKKSRSMSLEAPSAVVWYDEEDLDEMPRPTDRWTSTYVVLPSRAVDELQQVIQDESNTPLVVNKAIYRKHREFRRSVLEGSKMLDRARQARKLQSEQSENPRDKMTRRASLVMRRGMVPEGTEVPPSLPTVSDHEEKKLAAAKRSGRPRRTRTKTASDISGMIR